MKAKSLPWPTGHFGSSARGHHDVARRADERSVDPAASASRRDRDRRSSATRLVGVTVPGFVAAEVADTMPSFTP